MIEIDWTHPFVVSTIHFLKVVGFIALSGALTEILNSLAQLHLSTVETLIVSGVINGALAWVKKHQDLTNV